MTELTPLDIAQRELLNTTELAEKYLKQETQHAEILRTYVSDIQEDIAALEKLKGSFKEKEAMMKDLIARATRAKRDAVRQAQALEIAAKDAAAKETQREVTIRKDNIVKAPRVKLPIFDGENLADYRGFMLAFNSSLGNEPDADPVKKWLLLKPQLAGKALTMVQELPIAPETFEVALKILEDNFGGDRAAVMELYQRLQLLPNATLDTDSLKTTHARMEGILMSLERLQVDLEKDDFLRAAAISKYPDELQHLLRVTNKTSLSKFREEMTDYVAARSCTIKQMVTMIAGGAPAPTPASKGSKGGAEGSNQKQRHGTASTNSTGGATTGQAPPHQVTKDNSYQLKNKRMKGRLHKCIYCTGNHGADQCDVYPTLEARLKIVADRC